jgi:hypothetical protein
MEDIVKVPHILHLLQGQDFIQRNLQCSQKYHHHDMETAIDRNVKRNRKEQQCRKHRSQLKRSWRENAYLKDHFGLLQN